MRKLLLIVFLLNILVTSAQYYDVAINYTFNGTSEAEVTGASNLVTADTIAFGGDYLTPTGLVTDGNYQSWQCRIEKNVSANYVNSFFKCGFTVKEGYKMVITGITVRQRMEGVVKLPYVRIGMTLDGSIPQIGTDESMDSLKFYTSYVPYLYLNLSAFQEVTSTDHPTLYLSARSHITNSYDWLIDNIEIKGYLISESLSSQVTVTNYKQQKMRYGIDAERLWYWRTNGLSTKLAELGVKDIKSDYVRVAVNCAYERSEGVKDITAYNKILNMMNAMKAADPDIKFFASPRPLAEAYSRQEKEAEWGHVDNVPWSPYPRWILEWYQNGTKTMNDGTVAPNWKQGSFHIDKVVQYYADYLNLMHEKGFKISYLDVTNEKNIITPDRNKYVFDNLPGKLNAGVHMPALVVPSSWSRKQGIDWLKSVNRYNGEADAFEIAATHNTDPAGSAEAFSAEAKKLGKEVWNTELHGWVGIAPMDEIMNSEAIWEHIRGGFSGIDSWLFYGPYGGKDHTMVWSDNSNVRTSFKYEIFKQLVNSSQYGYYQTTYPPAGINIPVVSFITDSILTVWVLNTFDYALPDFNLHFIGYNIENKPVKVTQWTSGGPKTGYTSSHIARKSNTFDYNIGSKALYFFKIDLTQDATSAKITSGRSLRTYPNPAKDYLNIELSEQTKEALFSI